MNLKNKIIKHKKSMDVCFKVFYVIALSDRYALKGQWLNQAFVQSFVIDADKIEIPNDQIGEWLVCDQPELKCLRDSTWSEIAK